MKRSPSSQLLFDEAKKRGLTPEWLTDYGFFLFRLNGKTLYGYQTKNFANNQLCTWLTNDKFATRTLLEKNNLPNIPYCFTAQRAVLNTFFDKYHPLVVKPVFGERSEGVVLVTDQQKLLDHKLETTLFEKYIEGTEYRYLLFRHKIVAVQEKILSPTTEYPWRKEFRNLSAQEYNNDLITICERIISLIPQNILAIDFLVDRHGQPKILELNSMPGLWSFLHPDHGEPRDLASETLDIIIESQLDA